VLGGGMLVAISCTPNEATITTVDSDDASAQQDLARANIWLEIKPNAFVFTCAAAEMGQGVVTGLATLMCEELDLDPRKLTIELAKADPKWHEPGLPLQLTGGSETTRRYATPLREAGATTREKLRLAAAWTWSTSLSNCVADDGRVRNTRTGATLTYNELAPRAAWMPVVAPPLKDPSKYKWLGKKQTRLDAQAKVDGTAVFGMDVQLPGLRFAVVNRCPVIGGRVKTYDSTAARAMSGVEDIVAIGNGVAVVARTTWEAMQAAKALVITWEGANATRSSEGIKQAFAADMAQGGGLVAKHGSLSLRSKLNGAAVKKKAVYSMPYLAHAGMEPMNATAVVKESSCEIWCGSQVPGIARKVAMAETGLRESQVTVNNTFLGGGFGRRGRTDFIAEAVKVAKATKKPIKLVWTREDDTKFGIFRPLAYHEIEGGLDASGKLVGIEHKVACQSVYENLSTDIADAMFPGMKLVVAAAGGIFSKFVDPTSVEGSADTEYEIPDFRVEYYHQKLPIPIGAWRSVGHSFNAFVMDGFIDELAASAGKDPLEFRRGLLTNHPRMRAVLEQTAAKAGWGTALPQGVFRGVACNKSFESYAACVVELKVDGTRIDVQRIVMGIDCGEIVNPDNVQQQLEGAAIFGLSAALKGRITLKDGRVVESNYHDYEVVRMFECPRIETVLVASKEKPTGVGEPGVPVIAPAVANALFKATGRRLRELPLQL
jgi:isoquinoline 1-oxidoreductase beta subunit